MSDGTPRLAFQQVAHLPPPTWPDGPRPQMLHLDTQRAHGSRTARSASARLWTSVPPLRRPLRRPGGAAVRLRRPGRTPVLHLRGRVTFSEAYERDVTLPDGRVLHTYDTGPGQLPVRTDRALASRFAAERRPARPAARRRGRPRYPAALRRPTQLRRFFSSPHPGRSIGSAAGDVAQIVDALGVDRFAAVGASGGGTHALACAALLPDRVVGVVTLAGPVPYTSDLDWYAGMVAPGGPRAAAEGREARARYAETEEFDENSSTAADYAALDGAWASLGADAGRAGRAWPDGLIDDDVALVSPWGSTSPESRSRCCWRTVERTG